ncbi:MAG: Aerobic cobaltochelatase subunit CobT [Alphaproteobacteria bacterium MarineAlpha9_Bin3]|nr:MAG: Aerobic cobaltochelatase subunit CobT [Alphaproteobacteria bacterium MarineAlpha9_Bin3]|tara:strand:+ start:592 stop:2403 length:1812 start_codon:yes stop_codon:yes gene_type:complete
MTNNNNKIEVFKKSISSTLKAISKKKDLLVNFGSEKEISSETVTLPIPSIKLEDIEKKEIRGIADSIALKFKYHNKNLHTKLKPKSKVANKIFDSIEDARYESIGINEYSGIKNNLEINMESKYKNIQINKNDVAIEDATKLIIQEKLTNKKLSKDLYKVADIWRKDVESAINESIEELQLNMLKQKDFSNISLKLAEQLQSIQAEVDTEEDNQDDNDEDSNNEDEEENQDQNDDEKNLNEEDSEAEENLSIEQEETEIDIIEDENSESENSKDANPFYSPPKEEKDNFIYNAYTKKFDETISAQDLCDQDELTRLRSNLDKQIDNMDNIISQLANRLQRKLMAQQNRWWEFNLEEGVLDASRLTRIIINPLQSLSYKEEIESEFKDTIVTLLIDNSGSMRGRPITVAALSADILTRTLERCGVKVEILGFTTRSWKGGKARDEWIKNGRPSNPGRLNEIRHIIYKSASNPWRRSKTNLGLMLREGILKENIDGEAIAWATDRLSRRIEKRKILMVISDGAPVDDSTLSTNSGSYLDKHLRQIIKKTEANSNIELLAIGIGHDVTRYYKQALTIVEVDQLGSAITNQLAILFDKNKKKVKLKN